MSVVVSNPQELTQWFNSIGFPAQANGGIVTVRFKVYEFETGAFNTLILQSQFSRIYVGHESVSVISGMGRVEAQFRCMVLDYLKYEVGNLYLYLRRVC